MDLPEIDPTDPAEHRFRNPVRFGPHYDEAAHREVLRSQWEDSPQADRLYDMLDQAGDEGVLRPSAIRSTRIREGMKPNKMYRRMDEREDMVVRARSRIIDRAADEFIEPRLARPKG